MSVRPQKTQISLGIRPVWSEYSLWAQWVVKDPRFLHADSEGSDQTGWMPRLIWVFAGRTATLLVLLCRGSVISNELLNNCTETTAANLSSMTVKNNVPTWSVNQCQRSAPFAKAKLKKHWKKGNALWEAWSLQSKIGNDWLVTYSRHFLQMKN